MALTAGLSSIRCDGGIVDIDFLWPNGQKLSYRRTAVALHWQTELSRLAIQAEFFNTIRARWQQCRRAFAFRRGCALLEQGFSQASSFS
jgi:hypothetical protein